MKCPNCNETLLMSQRNNIEIDYCPSCRGVWLDRGELDKMLDYATQQSSTDNGIQNYRADDYIREQYNRDSYGNKKPHKKKSFLGDLFDFD